MIIAIDFDGTIVHSAYPAIGRLQPDARAAINRLSAEGNYIIIFTCRTGERLLEAINFLLSEGVKFNRVNSSHPAAIKFYGGEGCKVSADVYVDDKQLGGLPPWREVYEKISRRAW